MKQSIFYAIIISVSLFTFFIFRPYKFIEHNKTKIVCQKNNQSYYIGPNLIFAFEEKLDPQTDKNVRKLCEYAIINDSQNTFKTPEKVNYALSVAYEKEGSWVDTALVSSVIFLLMITILNKFFLNFKFFNPVAILIGLILFLFFLSKPAKSLFCERQMASHINNFKKSAYGYGLLRIQQEEVRIKPLLQQAYKKCVE